MAAGKPIMPLFSLVKVDETVWTNGDTIKRNKPYSLGYLDGEGDYGSSGDGNGDGCLNGPYEYGFTDGNGHGAGWTRWD